MSQSTALNLRRTAAASASNAAGPVGVPQDDGAAIEAIVTGCQRGDRRAQHVLYERCHEPVFRLLVRMVGQQDAPDLLQQVFLRVFTKIGQFSGRSDVMTWIYRLAVNESLQFRRSRGRVHYEMPADEPIDPAVDPKLRTEQQELMDRALAQLDSQLRAVFILKEVEGLSYREISAALGIKEGTVGSRLNQARAELRNILSQLGWKPEQ